MSPPRFPGPICRYWSLTEIDSGTLCRQTSPTPGPLDRLSLWPELYEPGFLPAALGMTEAITDADKAEFAIIKKMPVLDHLRRSYGNVSSYVSDRTLYFGSPLAYASFAAESDQELTSTKWVRKKHTSTLRSMLEFGKNPQQQQIFYRWVRKAYKRKYGDDVNVPELIRKGMSEELAAKITEVRGSIRVKKIHDEQFHAGGFNPRPIKYNHHYLLGTLSEHATGMAVDIDDTHNPQLTLEEWKFIETLAGKHVIRSGRWATEAAAEGLWKDIEELDDLFVKKIASEIQRIEKERAEKLKKEKEEKAAAAKGKAATSSTAGASAKPTQTLPPLKQILGTHFESLSQWAGSGFFHLPLELVLELHAHGFAWGATFSTNVDLHHFELPD
jgi:hypothetical protein